MLLGILGFLIGSRERNGQAFVLLSGMLGLAMVLTTIYIAGYSLWYLLYKLPLASAIRAMTRLDVVLLFPAAYLAAVAIDRLRGSRQLYQSLCIAIVLLVLIIELSFTTMHVSSKQTWRDRIVAKESTLPKQVSGDAVLFFAQNSGPYFADEIDAMWVSLKHRAKTLNGDSGISPPRFHHDFGGDCAELPKRLLAFLAFNRQEHDEEAYRSLVRRVVPIGFKDCNPEWLVKSPQSNEFGMGVFR